MYRGRDRGGRFDGGGRGRGGFGPRGGFRGGRGFGGHGFGGRGGDRFGPENGFCVVHQRKRLMSDLMPVEGQPRTFRCRPQKECYQRQEVEEATCHLHNRRRKVTQMREVRAGVWECLPTSLCRQFGNGPMGVPVVAPVGARGRDFSPPSRRARHEGPEAAASPWAPAAATRVAQASAHAGRGDGGERAQVDIAQGEAAAAFRARRGAFADRKVWCARHGKHLSASQCDAIGDCCFICTDHTLCLSTPLDDTAALQSRDCRELLCTRHSTLRSVAFLRLNDDRDGYQCVRGHACRGVTLPQMELADANAVDGGADGGFVGQAEDTDAFGGQDAYFGATGGAGADDAYGEQTGREAVSSFFV